MKRTEVLDRLKSHMPEIKERFGVRDLVLFGPISRATAGEESDIDILVAFGDPANSDRYFGLQSYLEDLLGRPVR